MHSQAERLLRLVNQLLDLHKLEDKNHRLHPSFGNIVAFSQEVLNDFQALTTEKEQDYHFIHQKDIWADFDKDKWEKSWLTW